MGQAAFTPAGIDDQDLDWDVLGLITWLPFDDGASGESFNSMNLACQFEGKAPNEWVVEFRMNRDWKIYIAGMALAS